MAGSDTYRPKTGFNLHFCQPISENSLILHQNSLVHATGQDRAQPSPTGYAQPPYLRLQEPACTEAPHINDTKPNDYEYGQIGLHRQP